MSSLPVSLTEHHGEVDVLEIEDTDGQVGGQDTGQQDDVSLGRED